MIEATVKFHQIIERQVRFGMKNIDFEVYLVEDEAGPIFQFTCVDYDLNPIDLSGKTVDLYIKSALSRQLANAGATSCIVIDPAAGIVQFQLQSPFIEEPGTYFGDLSISDGGSSNTAPQFIRLIVRESNK